MDPPAQDVSSSSEDDSQTPTRTEMAEPAETHSTSRSRQRPFMEGSVSIFCSSILSTIHRSYSSFI